MAEGEGGKRGRPEGVAAEVARETGLSLRTVQRVLAAGRAKPEASDDERTVQRFLEVFRNFASFCRDNDPRRIAALPITAEQSEKLAQWNEIIEPWMRAVKGLDEDAGVPPRS